VAFVPAKPSGKRPRWNWRDRPITDDVLTEIESDPERADQDRNRFKNLAVMNTKRARMRFDFGMN
jgi:hypothetical protein